MIDCANDFALPTPSLLLDLDVLERNIAAMAARAAALGVRLRPHWKTHKCIEVARLQARHSAFGGTVSTLEEARAFADAGFDDITWPLPLPLTRLVDARTLARRVTLRVVVDSEPAIAALVRESATWHVWLKVDCGYHRAGVDPDADALIDLAQRIDQAPHLTFDGLLSHSGHAYRAVGREARAAVAEEERQVMVDAKTRIEDAGIAVPAISVGSTPAMTAVEHLEGVDEARPGNYVFFDHTQVALGSCGVEDCALSVLTSVISCPPGADHAVVDAGALALSQDPGARLATPRTMGEVLADGSPMRLDGALRLVSLSQEHGVLNRPVPVGTKLRILPNHSCLAAACFDQYTCIRGGEVIDRWQIRRERS